MRILGVAIVMGGACCVGGCAHDLPDAALGPGAVASYRAVRSGAAPVSAVDGVQFCAADGAVEVVSKRAHGYDDWADKFRDGDVQQEVRDLLHRDRRLAAASLDVRVDEGEAIVSGTVQRDADAVAAAHDALAVPGVIAVQLRTASAESPSPPRLVATRCE